MITTITIGTAQGLRILKLSEDEMQAFQRFQHIYPELVTMLQAGVFDFKRGRAIIHRDDIGQLRKIEVELTRWSS